MKCSCNFDFHRICVRILQTCLKWSLLEKVRTRGKKKLINILKVSEKNEQKMKVQKPNCIFKKCVPRPKDLKFKKECNVPRPGFGI